MSAIRSALVVTVAWSIAAGTYVLFRGDVFTRLIGLQTEMQITHEDRIADLRAQVDHTVSQQFLDQKQVARQLNALLQGQATLEQRTSALTGDLSATGIIEPARNAPPGATSAERSTQAPPLNDTVVFVASPLSASATRFSEYANAGGVDGMLARISLSLDRVEQRQVATLTDLEERIDTRARRIRSVLADLGIDNRRASPRRPADGPVVLIEPPKWGASVFERLLYRINVARAQLERYTRALVTVPLRKPVIGEVVMSSPFGIRRDPFLGRPAVHTGIDMLGEVGEPVRATATGRVTMAGRQGGYGNMVEISHGNGLATRYGHLSKITVKIGQTVRIGEIVGKIGSTGRSTGPHLHYETRINGEAVDPQKFLRAGLGRGDV